MQSALLEAMEERQVTVSGKRYAMPDLFMVLATQNPIEQEGTYPLPEAQMDRFLMHVTIDYPSDANEEKIMRLVRNEKAGKGEPPPQPIAQSAVFAARKEIDAVSSVEAVERYIVALIAATRRPSEFGDKLKGWITYRRQSAREPRARRLLARLRVAAGPEFHHAGGRAGHRS